MNTVLAIREANISDQEIGAFHKTVLVKCLVIEKESGLVDGELRLSVVFAYGPVIEHTPGISDQTLHTARGRIADFALFNGKITLGQHSELKSRHEFETSFMNHGEG